MSEYSGVSLRELLEDPRRSYNPSELDILEGFRKFSREKISADISGQFSRDIFLKLPVVTAPMPDVTDAHIAIVAARNGGLGIVPATFSPEDQAAQVRAVKKSEGGFIENPFSLNPNNTIGKALSAPYSNIPVIEGKKLVGMFVRDQYGEYFYRQSKDAPISTAMLTDLSRIAVSPDEVTVEGGLNFQRAQAVMEERITPALAVVNHDRELLYLVTMKDVASKETYYPNATRDGKNRLCVGAAILEYMTEDNLQRIKLLAGAEVDVFVIEQAHAWNVDAGKLTKYLKFTYPHINVVPGNDSVSRAVLFHHKNGADGVKIGQGPGSICITGDEDVIGLWRPQLSAVFDCGRAARQCEIPCTSDGGIKAPYDAFKVFCAGASAVMLGSLAAATSDSPAKEVEPGKKLYRAMGSPELVKAHSTAFHKYNPETFIPEGNSRLLPITTSFEDFLRGFDSKLKRIFERFGAENLGDLHQKLINGEIRAQYAHNRSTR
jgi:IMP dehydrogenase